MHTVPCWWTLLLAAAIAGAYAPCSSAQVEDARRALVKVEVMDEGLHEALEIRKSQLPLKEKEAKLAKIKIQQQFRLLVSGVAISSHEVVTPALHPTARLRVILTFHDGSKHRAALIGTDPRTNLALVRSPVPLPHYLEPHVEKLEVRQGVELVGHSMVEPLQASGFVTQVRMSVRLLDIYGIHEADTIPLGCVFVVAAPALPCNPGTACLDAEGRLVGIVLGCAPAQVMAQAKGEPGARLERSFVVPSRRILKITQALREHKRVVRADFGFALASVSEALRAQLPDLPACAATVNQLSVTGPAAKGGIRNNDILLAVNGQAPEDVHLLRELLTECDPTQSVQLTVLRAGKKLDLSVEPTAVR